MRARAEWRARARPLISAMVLCGLFGAAVMATWAGARRTETAYPRFLERQRAYDLLVTDASFFAPVFWKPDFDALARLPYVEKAVLLTGGGLDGGDDLPEGTGFHGSRDPEFGESINVPVLVKGRLPDPQKADEIAVPYFAETRTAEGTPGLGTFRVGDRVDLLMGGKPVPFRVVGETAFPGELPPTPQYGWQVLVSSAFLDTYARDCVPFQASENCGVPFALEGMEIRFKHPSDIALFERDVKAMTGGKVLAPQEQTLHARSVTGSTDLQAAALRLLALFIGLTGLMIVGQLLARETAFGASDAATLRALGLGRTQLFQLGLARVLPVAVGGAALAVALAWVGSGIFPRGSVRAIEPSMFAFDSSILGLGFPIMIALMMLVVAMPAWRAAAPVAAGAMRIARPSRIAATLGSMGLPTPMVAGSRLALERGRGRTAVPVISSLIVVALGVASFVAATTVAGSLRSMIQDPSIYGKTWDEVVSTGDDALFDKPDEQRIASEQVAEVFVADPDVEALAFVDSGAPLRLFSQDGPARGVSVLGLTILDRKGSLLSPVVEGRRPGAGSEVVLGARMIDDLRLTLDDANPPTIQVGFEGAGDKRATVRVVGRAVIPPLGNFGQLGYGVLFGDISALGEALSDTESVPPQTDLIVRWRSGVDPATVIARHQVRFPFLKIGESLTGGKFADAVNFGGVQGAPLIVGGVLAFLGAAALAHVLTTSIRRRRRDIAILKTIGFVRGQARRAVAWQATITVLVAGVIGAPLGVIGGRWIWTSIANGIGVISSPQVSLSVLLVLPIALVVLANVIALLPARAAAGTQPALVLRSE